MTSFESFKPQLKPGKVSLEGERIIFECDHPFEQIVLPNEMAELLAHCTGQHTIRDIIEQIYRKSGTVHFKLVHSSILRLCEKDLLVNSEDLDRPAKNFSPRADSHDSLIRPIYQIFVGRRVFNTKSYPQLFYICSLITLILGIVLLGVQDTNSLFKNMFTIEGSTILGISAFYICSSILLSGKNLIKLVYSLVLTGRAYNFRIVFSVFATYFRVGSDSLFLVTNKLYLTLFHMGIIFSYFILAYLMALVFPESWGPIINLSALAMFFAELDPYRESELSQYFRRLFGDESLVKLSQYYKVRSLFSLLQPRDRRRNQALYGAVLSVGLIWSLAMMIAIGAVMSNNVGRWLHVINSESVTEKIAAVLLVSLALALSAILLVSFVRSFFGHLISPSWHLITQQLRRRNMGSIEQYKQNDLIKILEDLPLFSYFNKELLVMIIGRSEVRRYPAQTPIIIQGDKADSLFVLLDGSVRIQKRLYSGERQKIGEILPISIFGETAVIEDITRTAEVVTIKEAIVLAIPAKIIRKMAEQSQYIREINDFRNVIMVNQFFTSAPLFRELPNDIIHQFLVRGKIETYEKNQVVFRQGSRGDGFYLIIRGAAGVTVNEQPVNKILQGGFFGEVSVIADVPRTATISALEPTVLLKISAETFWELLAQNIEMAMFIEAIGKMRVKEDIDIIRKGDVRVTGAEAAES